MNNLLQLFIRNGGFITFFVLEAVSFYLIVGNNQEQGKIYAHSRGLFADKVYEVRSNFRSYFRLKDEAEALRQENAYLRTQNLNARLVEVPYMDTSFQILYDTLSNRREYVRPAYEYVPATVISNSISLENNWLMINRGLNDSIGPHMGVVSEKGIVGIVRHTSSRFASVMSVLHRQCRVSAAIKGKGAFGSLVWNKPNPRYATLKDIPRHIDVAEGDTIVTSGYSSVFPGGHPVGYIVGRPTPDRDNQYYYDIKVQLSQDPSDLDQVYVVRNLFRSELDSLLKASNEQR